jgi:hypothetical protein
LKVVSVDGAGGGGFGAGRRGSDAYVKVWESSDGIRVSELVVAYPSSDDARKDYAEWLKGAETIIERTGRPHFLSDTEESVVATYVKAESQERVVRVVKLRIREIYSVEAPSLEYALAFK